MTVECYLVRGEAMGGHQPCSQSHVLHVTFEGGHKVPALTEQTDSTLLKADDTYK